jgi:hypothetical protein
MHAIFRALGADFRNNGRFNNGMFERVSTKGGTIQYNYALPVPRVGALYVWPGDAWLIGGLNGPPSSTDVAARAKSGKGQVYFIVWYPVPIIDRIRDDVFVRSDVSCPPVPPQDLEGYFADAAHPEL